MPSTILELILKARDDASRTMQGFTGKVREMFGGFTELSSAVTLAEKGLQAAKKVVEETINVAVDYNKQIREMSQFTGLSAEETSRLVQVADDWGITIPQLRTSLQMMVKNGVVPSIENLAALAEEYQNTADKTAFAEKMAKLLGRQWTTLLPMISKGKQAFLDQAAAVDENLIATENSIQAARDYELALDNVNDAITAQKIAIGNELLPLLTQVLTPAQKEVIDGQVFMVKTIGDQVQAWTILNGKQVEATNRYLILKGTMSDVRMEAQKGYDTKPLEELGGAADETAGQISNVAIALGDVTKASLASEAMRILNEEFKKTGDVATYKKLATEVMLTLGGMTGEEVNAAMALFDLNLAQETGTVQAPQYIDKLKQIDDFYNVMPAKVEGLTSDTYLFGDSVKNVGQTAPGVIGGVTGSFDTLTGEVEGSRKEVQGLQSDIDALHDKTITIKTVYETTGEISPGGALKHKKRQYGGTVEPGGIYEVTEGGKSELLSTPSGNYLLAGEKGKVIPISKGGGGGGGNTFIVQLYVSAPAGASAEAIATLAAQKMIYALSRPRGSWRFTME